MINNYYTLNALAKEIHEDLVSSVIEALFTRVQDTLEIVTSRPGRKSNVIVISCKARGNYLFMRPAPKKRAGANVFRDALGSAVSSVYATENERAFAMSLSDGKSIVVNLFGPHANAYLADEAGQVRDMFLRKKSAPDRVKLVPAGEAQDKMDPEFAFKFNSAGGSPAQKLAAVFPPFSRDLAKEAFYRLGGESMMNQSFAKDYTLRDDAVVKLAEMVQLMCNELNHPQPRIYYDGENPVIMSLLEMHHLGSYRQEAFESVNACIGAYAVNADRQAHDDELKNDILARLMKKQDELARTIARVEEDISNNREEKYRTFGDVIMAHLPGIERGSDSMMDSDTGAVITLDPKLSAVQNAQAYYEKSKKAREAARKAVARKRELSAALESVRADLASVEAEGDINRLASTARKVKEKEETRTPFREFETGGWKIYVGKDAKNNDQLTFGFAKPNDVFLHARGVSGSHVIVRNSSRDYPQKPIIEFAAKIAAYYSRARTSGIVPVAYTMRKFVKKARGRPGAVILDREEVILVKPEIPRLER